MAEVEWFPDGIEGWEPGSPEAWADSDVLHRLLVERQHAVRDPADRWDEGAPPLTADQEFSAYARLPIPYRRIAWREREIAAQILITEGVWMETPALTSVGVGIRTVAGGSRLCVVLTTTDELAARIPVWSHGIPSSLMVTNSRLPWISGSEVEIPVAVEYRPRVLPLARPSAIVESPGCPPEFRPTLRTGLPIVGQSDGGWLIPGTLGGLAIHIASGEHYVFGAAHVFGSRSIELDAPPRVPLGKVEGGNAVLDVACARLQNPHRFDLRLPGSELTPGWFVQPVTGMAVQFWGAASAHQTGYIDQAISFPLSAYRIGHVSRITVNISSQGGDSGAVLYTGHNGHPAAEADLTRYLSPDHLHNLRCAPIGVLVAGPAPGMDPALAPVTSFSMLSQALYAMNLDIARP